ncbi:MerR family DNA-binding protein [Sporolactobacillus terrae]|uniref:MerR family DNA-binding protein n=1 Tax=Sporolactobacillus terrae TaxID=269673 RepID=UPI002F96520F
MIRRINFARQMRSAGISVEALQKYIRLFDANEDNTQQQIALLQEQLELMEEKRDDLQAAIDHLRWKLNNYDSHMSATEEALCALEREHKTNNSKLD